jgi:hypothetical protein
MSKTSKTNVVNLMQDMRTERYFKRKSTKSLKFVNIHEAFEIAVAFLKRDDKYLFDLICEYFTFKCDIDIKNSPMFEKYIYTSLTIYMKMPIVTSLYRLDKNMEFTEKAKIIAECFKYSLLENDFYIAIYLLKNYQK